MNSRSPQDGKPAKPSGASRATPAHAGPHHAPAALHPRNRHQGRYDFVALVAASPELAAFVKPNPFGDISVDFANPEAVKALNRALLKHQYGLTSWDIPPGYLCPPIPGRADYIHHLADLLASGNGGVIPTGTSVRVLDVGVGANCVYPLIGHGEYGWSFVGSDIDPDSLDSAARIVSSNPGLSSFIRLRLQRSPERIFDGVIEAGEHFDLTLCNPPFHASAEEASEGSRRKWHNLGKGGSAAKAPALNFGGRGAELWCPGGEEAFVRRMIAESARIPGRCRWFSTLISKSSHLPWVHDALRYAGVADMRVLDMAQGQKKSRIVAWTFLTKR